MSASLLAQVCAENVLAQAPGRMVARHDAPQQRLRCVLAWRETWPVVGGTEEAAGDVQRPVGGGLIYTVECVRTQKHSHGLRRRSFVVSETFHCSDCSCQVHVLIKEEMNGPSATGPADSVDATVPCDSPVFIFSHIRPRLASKWYNQPRHYP